MAEYFGLGSPAPKVDRNTIIEECARECDEWAEAVQNCSGNEEQISAYRNAAAAIRALKD